ncbi:MAG TPA: hypothetical protein VHE10_00295 [Candidatus Paceibacterota bacterium]|nr:hypothetical protein [Candidatus Paceibacterota bacterium]
MSVRCLPIEHGRPGFRTVGEPIPEPSKVIVGDPPALAPFKVTFELYGGEDEKKDPTKTSPEHIKRSMEKAYNQNLCGEFWIRPDGSLVRSMFWRDIMQKTILQKPVVSLRIDCSDLITALMLTRLAAYSGPVNRIDSGFSCESWRLLLSCKESPEWNDLLLFFDGRFVLKSVLLEAVKGKAC